jgi:hypothetical protein
MDNEYRDDDYRGLRNLKMNCCVCPWMDGSNTFMVRGSAGLSRITLSPSKTKPAASTSRRTMEGSMRCRVSVTSAEAPGAAAGLQSVEYGFIERGDVHGAEIFVVQIVVILRDPKEIELPRHAQTVEGSRD